MAQPETEVALRERLDPTPPPAWPSSTSLTVEHLEQLFDERTGSTIGMEEELMLLDRETLEISPSAQSALGFLADDDRFDPERRQGQIEVRTPRPAGAPDVAGVRRVRRMGRGGGVFPDASHIWWDLRPIRASGRSSCVPWTDRRTSRMPLRRRSLPVSARLARRAPRSGRGAHGGRDEPDRRERLARARVRHAWVHGRHLEPTAERYGTSWAFLTARALLADNGADRQRHVATERGLMGLTRWLAQETVWSARDYLERRT